MQDLCADVLRRDSVVNYSAAASQFIEGKTILVTGAGGSIGSELVKHCQMLNAGRIVKVDSDETALYNLSMQLFGRALFESADDLHLVDVGNQCDVSRIMTETAPDVVFHAAAKKHLPLTQAEPAMAVRTNVFGTLAVVQAAAAAGVPRVVNISTDKAADPTSVLGLTKRLAEQIGAHYSTDRTRVASVRFGNVLGSRGSLLPSIAFQLERGKSIQLTDPQVSRYFMTVGEAASLVIESADMAQGKELFVLDMGEPILIRDLIERFADAAGYARPTLEITGLRPGEKLREEIFDSGAPARSTTRHPRISSMPIPLEPELESRLATLENLLCGSTQPSQIRAALEI